MGASSAGPTGVNVAPEIVPFHMPTVSSAVPGSSVALGTLVLTVNVHVPAGKPDAPPAGSTIQPVPPGVVGIEASLVVDCAPGGKTYQPLSAALLTETLLVVASAALVLLFSTAAAGHRARDAPQPEWARVVRGGPRRVACDGSAHSCDRGQEQRDPLHKL